MISLCPLRCQTAKIPFMSNLPSGRLAMASSSKRMPIPDVKTLDMKVDSCERSIIRHGRTSGRGTSSSRSKRAPTFKKAVPC